MAPLTKTFRMLDSAAFSIPILASGPASTSSLHASRKISPEQEAKNRHLSELFNNVWYGQTKRPQIKSSSGNAGNSQIVAIDSKIEQAMDLVKTHLMFAVREEVEVLRNKILQLETTVLQLEAENAILREHVPTEILQNLNGGSGAPTSQNTTYVAAQ